MFKSLAYLASVCLLVGCLGDPKERIEVANDATLNNEPKAPKKNTITFPSGGGKIVLHSGTIQDLWREQRQALLENESVTSAESEEKIVLADELIEPSKSSARLRGIFKWLDDHRAVNQVK